MKNYVLVLINLRDKINTLGNLPIEIIHTHIQIIADLYISLVGWYSLLASNRKLQATLLPKDRLVCLRVCVGAGSIIHSHSNRLLKEQTMNIERKPARGIPGLLNVHEIGINR